MEKGGPWRDPPRRAELRGENLEGSWTEEASGEALNNNNKLIGVHFQTLLMLLKDEIRHNQRS